MLDSGVCQGSHGYRTCLVQFWVVWWIFIRLWNKSTNGVLNEQIQKRNCVLRCGGDQLSRHIYDRQIRNEKRIYERTDGMSSVKDELGDRILAKKPDDEIYEIFRRQYG